MLMEMFMKENGSMTKLMVTEFTSTLMEPNSKDNGSKINKRVKELKLGPMEQNMKVSTNSDKKM